MLSRQVELGPWEDKGEGLSEQSMGKWLTSSGYNRLFGKGAWSMRLKQHQNMEQKGSGDC